MGDVCPGITRDQLRRLCRGVRTSPRPRHTAAAARKLTRRGAGGGAGQDIGRWLRRRRRLRSRSQGRGQEVASDGSGADVARMLVADQPDLRCTSPCADSRRNLYKTVHHQSDAAATRAGDKEHCLQWRHGAMTTANPTHRRYPITSTTPDREGAQPSAEVTSPRVNLTSGSGVAVTSDRGYHQCGHPRPG